LKLTKFIGFHGDEMKIKQKKILHSKVPLVKKI